MNHNEDRKKCIVLGVTGGIAVYKAADLCSKLAQRNYEVVTVMTQNACKLISERIFFTLSRNPVITDLFSVQDWKPEHIALAERADLLLVAPCTANFIGKYAHGIADDALTTTAMAHRKPVLLAPAMNTWMWQSPAVQENCEILRKRGVFFAGPVSGALACGTSGEGRMCETAEILREVERILGKEQPRQ